MSPSEGPLSFPNQRHGRRGVVPSMGAPTAVGLCLLLSILLGACAPTDPVQDVEDQLARGEVQSAVAAARELVELRPDDPEILLLYGRVLGATREFALAEWPLRKAMRHPKWLVPAGIEVASFALRSVNYTAAIDVLDQVLEAEPDNLTGLALRANAYAQSRFDAEAALEDVEKMRKIDPENVGAYKPEILAYLALGRAEEANEALERLGERIRSEGDEDEMGAWHCTTMALFATEGGESELAETRWNDCLENYPTDAKIVTEAIDFFDKKGDRDRSLAIAEKAVEETEPAAWQFRVLLAQRLQSRGRTDEAESLLRAGAESPEPMLAMLYAPELARFLSAAGRPVEALAAGESAFANVREVGEPQPVQIFGLADLAIRARAYDRALELADRVSVEAYQLLIRARVAQERGDHTDALELFDRAGSLWPDNTFARYHAARSAEALGLFDRALELYRHATRIDVDATDAETRIARIQLAEGGVQAAYTTLKRHRDRAGLDPEGEILMLRLLARAPENESLWPLLERFVRTHPAWEARAIAKVSIGLRESNRRAAALDLLQRLRPEFYDDERSAEVLRELVPLAETQEEREWVRARVQRTLDSLPESSWSHELSALAAERLDSDTVSARAHYQEALRLDSDNGSARARLGRLSVEHDPATAARHLEQATRSDRPDVESIRAGAIALAERGAVGESTRVLAALLRAVPHDGAAAERLCRQRFARGEMGEVTLDLAERAARFSPSKRTRALRDEVLAAESSPESSPNDLPVAPESS